MLELDLYIGAEVFWNDPDNGLCSGFYEIKDINGDIYILKNESVAELEALEMELS